MRRMKDSYAIWREVRAGRPEGEHSRWRTAARGEEAPTHLPGAGTDPQHHEELDYSGTQMIALEGLTYSTAILPNGSLQSVKSIIFKP